MAKLKKNAMAQVLFVMVDKGDFATIESGITASDFNSAATKKFYGVNHGVSTLFTSGSISKATSLVRSGIFQQTLKAAETNYDYIVYRFTHPSCADQVLVFETVDNDDSDLMSALTVIQSMASDAHSAAAQANSRVLLNQSRISDVQSFLSDMHSDLLSYLAGMSGVLSDTYSLLSDTNSDLRSLLVTTGIALDASTMSDLRSAITAGPAGAVTVSDISDIASAVWAHAVGTRVDSRVLLNLSRISDVYSLVSDFYSDFQSRVPKRVATDSQLSDLHSDLRSYLVGLSGTLSDAYSGITLLNSAFIGHTGSTASQVTDASTLEIDGIDHDDQFNGYYVKVLGGSQIDELRLIVDTQKTPSHIIVKPAFNSRLASGVDFVIVAGNPFQSRFHSDVMSRISDVGSDLRSFLTIMSGVQSDTYSLLSDMYSDFQSRVPKLVATNSQLSDVHSDLLSYLAGVSGMTSDIYSLLSDTNSDFRSLVTVTGVQLNASTMSDLRSAIAAVTATLSASDISDIASAVWSAKYTANSVASSFGSLMSDIYSRIVLDQSRISDVQSMLSDFYSDFQSRVPKRVATDSQLSDLHSDLRSLLVTTGVALDASTMSDLRSAITAGPAGAVTVSDISDIASAVWAFTAGSGRTLTASGISDIASAVWGQKYTAHSAASTFGSLLSDIYSRAGGAVTASDISDIASAVRAILVSDLSDILSAAQQTNSRVLLNQSRISDTYSMLSDFYSDFQSRVPKRVATDSQLSDLHSDIRSFLTVMSGVLSDAYSGVQLLESAFIGHTGSTASQVTDASTLEIDGIDHDDQFNGYYVKILGGSQVDELRLIVDTQKTPSHIIVKPAFNSRLTSGIDFVIVAGNPFQSRMHSDVMSRVSDVGSDLRSFLLGMSGMQSDTYSLLSDMYSDFQSRVPKRVATDSQLSDVHSDLASKIAGITASVSASDISDIASAVWAFTTRKLTSNIGLNASDMSDIRSAINAGPAATVTASDISDIASAVWAHVVGARVDSRVLLNQSRISDVYSLLSDTASDLRSLLATTGVALDASTMSDLRSAITAGGGALTTSDISDIASAVWAAKYTANSAASSFGSLMSDIYSRVVLTQSMTSDVDSALTSRFSNLESLLTTTGIQLNASTMSDLRSAIAGVTATLSVSDISDIASAVRAILVSDLSDIYSGVQQTNSRALVIQSLVSDVDSALTSRFSDILSLVTTTGVQLNTSTMSDLRSAIANVTATLSVSDISDIASAVRAVLVSDLSDILSAAQQTNSRVLLNQSRISDIASFLVVMSGVLSDTYSFLGAGVPLDASTMSDLRSAIAGVSITASDMSDIASAVWNQKYTAASNVKPSTFGSALRLNMSRISDVQSYMVGMSGMLSDVHSAAVQTNSRAAVIQSQTSDIYSLLSDVSSDINVLSGVVSDIYSDLSAFHSDFESRFPATIPELTTDPGATPTWQQAEALQFMWLRNNSKTTTTKRMLRNNAGATVLSGTMAETAGTSFVQGKLG